MSVEIPWTRIAGLAIRPQSFSGDQEGSLGGPSLPIPRLGDRFAVDIETTQFRQDAESRLFIAAVFEATTAGARIALRQPNASRALRVFSSPVVDGAGQSGSTLAVRGLVRGQTVTRGDFLSIVHGGNRYLHMIAGAGQISAGADGKVAIPLWPMLRFLSVDAEPVELTGPMIEGKLVGFDKGAAFKRARAEPLSFSIVERA